jgi:serine/threonine protein kinase
VGDSKGVKIIQTIGTGGTAVLHKAVQTSLDRIVAVKRLHKHLTDDENFTRRFILEAKAAASLDHENIVHVIDFGRGEDGYEIVMEFVEGDSLKEILERWRPIKSELALAMVHQICLGLEHAHAKGIVHRDIKPGNVMLTKYGRVKITDFGLAKLTEAAASFTADNSIIGTPLYMSPEQAFGESVDQRSDLFSLGTVLYELVTGRQPFASENYMGVIQNIIHKNIPAAREVNPGVPDEVEAILSRALNKDRDQRFQTAREFREAIEEHVGIVELNRAGNSLQVLLERNTATQVMPKPDVATRKRKPKRGVGRGIAAAAAMLVLVGGAATVLFRPDLVERFTGEGRSEPIESRIQRSEAVLTPVGAAFDLGTLISTAPDTSKAPHNAEVVSAKDVPAVDSTSTIAEKTTIEPAPEPEPAPKPEPQPAPVVRTGFLSVNVSPGAEVYIDGAYRGDAPPPLRLELTTGPHTLECRRPRHQPYRESLRITTGELSRRNVTLEMLKGTISVNTQAGAQVFVDGKLLGVTPFRRPLEVDAGPHQVTIKKVGFNAWSSHITVRARETLPLNITLSPKF